jgi:predicted RNA-binding protein with PUA-like domain
VPGVAGVVEITREAFPDPTQFDPASDYYDPASRRDDPRWYCVEVGLKRKLTRVITLSEIKAHSKRLQGLVLLRPGNRLSVLPVDKSHWDFILRLE